MSTIPHKHKVVYHLVVDQEIRDLVQNAAKPFETYNMALRRLLGLPVERAPLGRPNHRRKKQGSAG